MKKYHNDIGNPLDSMQVLNQYTPDSDDSLSRDFCMLTIDLRHVRSLKQSAKQSLDNTVSRTEGDVEFTSPNVSTLSIVNSPHSTSSRVNTSTSVSREQKSPSNRKSCLFHKFTCSLFQRKHMCSRCKRKSRSSISNKTISKTEKRHTCCRCREKSQNMKNISKESDHSNSSSRHLSISQSKERVISVPRKNIKDSGYDTVTSCSTVASAYSAFSTPANTRQQNIIKDKATAKHAPYCDNGLSVERNANKLNNVSSNFKPIAPCEYSDHDSISEAVVDSESRISNFLTHDRLEFTEDEFTQVQKRKVQGNDGYLPEVDHNKCSSILSDTSNLEDTSENGDSCYFPPRIIRVSPTEKKSDSSQKVCYTCDSTTKPCFRLPWEGGWVCEDCLDGLH